MRLPFPKSGRPRRIAAAIVVTLVAFAALWSVPRVSSAAASWLTAPPVRSKTVTPERPLVVTRDTRSASSATEDLGAMERLSASQSEAASASAGPPDGAAVSQIDARMRFEMVGLVCEDADGVDSLTVYVRAGPDGRSWGEWFEAPVERVAEEGDEANASVFTDPIWVGGARHLQVAVTSADGSRRTVPSPRLVFLNTSGDATLADRLTTAARTVACTLGGLRVASDVSAMTTKPTIVLRSQWGADESLRTGSPSFAPLKMAFVHHTAGSNSYTAAQAPSIVRGIYYYHTQTLDWSDIGYNFLIDRYGVIYEGRYGGITNAPIGAHVLGFNTSSTGISVMGTFSTVQPPSAAMTSLKRLLAWKLDVHHVNPLAKAEMLCRTTQKYTEGQIVTFPVISGHRQANWTACPGDAFYALLPAVRKTVGSMGLPKIYDVVIDRTAFSPNGDDFRDTITLSFVGSEVLDWVLQVKAADDTVVRRKTGRGQSVSINWAGLSDAGELVPDGPYRLVLSATSPLGTARASTTEVVVDTRPPVPSSCVLSSPFLSPNGDGYADRARLTYNCGEPVYARVSILDEAGAVVRALTSWQKLGSTRVTTAWDGKIPVDGVLRRAPEGLYAYKLELRDPAGNTGVTTRAVTLDLTLGFFTATELSFSPNADGVKDETVVGFTLTRTVATRVAILLDDTVVRTLQLGELDAGTHSATWDGTDEEGLVAASGVYKVRVEAESAIGYSRIGRRITLDRTKPRITAPLTAKVTLGSTVRMRYVVADAWSPTVKVKVTIVRASDRVIVKKLYIGWVTSGEAHVASWTPPARRKYIAVFRATDEAGNRQAEAVSCVITVL